MSTTPHGDRAVIGIDFDNTIARYDTVFHAAALRCGLIDERTEIAKSAVRDSIRQRADGELEWQRLQAEVYGPRMPEAQLIDGVLAFLRRCRTCRSDVYVVSHKTEFAARDTTRTNLRQAALKWMNDHALLQIEQTGLDRERVLFESTRKAKVARIAQLGCTHFIDDLPEVLLDPGFPAGVARILLAEQTQTPPDVLVARNWDDVTRAVFDD